MTTYQAKTKEAASVIAAAVLILLVTAIVVGGAPWVFFWCVKALTGFVIPYTLKTWFAGLLIMALLWGNRR